MIRSYILPGYLLKYMPDYLRSNLKRINPLDDISLNVAEAARELGLRSFDTILPQSFVEEFVKITGESPMLYFVWVYPGNYLEPITREGTVLLKVYHNLTEKVA